MFSNHVRLATIAMFLLGWTLPLKAQSANITALSFFKTDANGTVISSERWNTIYPDPAWDVGVYEGSVINDPAEFSQDLWLNDPTDLSVDIPLAVGEERTFSVHVGRIDTNTDVFYGLNIFFDGQQSGPQGATAGISVFAHASSFPPGGGVFPPFAANGSSQTMGWPFDPSIPGAADGLVYEDADNNIRVVLTDYAVFTQFVPGGGAGLDYGSAQEPGARRITDGPDGAPELVGQFTVRVENITNPGPPEILSVIPSADGVVRSLSQVQVTFDKAVQGVHAADLLINNVPASTVSGSGAGPYVFEFSPQADGPVEVGFSDTHGIEDLSDPPFDFAGASWNYTVDSSVPGALVKITEFLTANATGITDEDGDREDWIEICNVGGEDVNLGGMSLTDDHDEPGQWVFPSRVLQPGQYLLVFASRKDRRPESSGNVHANFKLNSEGEGLAIYSADSPRQVIHEYAPAYPEQRTEVSFGLNALDETVYFLNPTPGEPNTGPEFSSLVADTRFNFDRGFYDQAFEVEISTETEDAVIVYTTDGTEPTLDNGELYENALLIDSTTLLRAAAFRDGFLPTNVDTQTYLFLDDIVLQSHSSTLAAGFASSWDGVFPDYGLDPDVVGQGGVDAYAGKYVSSIADDLRSVPALSIVLDIDDMFGSNGIYSHPLKRGVAWERAASVELIYADGRVGFQQDAGVRIAGGAFRRHDLTKKKSFRLQFKGIYGASTLDYPLFFESADAVQSFDSLVLRANNNDGWQWSQAGPSALYVRDSFAREAQLEMGQASAHELFVHLYLNGAYWGLYNLTERPDESFCANYFGGEKEEWGIVSIDFPQLEGDVVAWHTFASLASQVSTSNAAYQMIQGNDPDGTRNLDFEVHVDIDSYIDYLIVNHFIGNTDWSRNNFRMGKRRVDSTGFKFFSWDAETSLDLKSSLNRTTLTTNKVTDGDGVAGPYSSLRANPEFRLRFADRIHQHFFNGGIFYVDPSSSQWNPEEPERNRPAELLVHLTEKIDRAIVGESARWGDQHDQPGYARDEHWEIETDNLLTNYFPQRSAIVLQQYRAANLYPQVVAPTFNVHGGVIDPNFAFVMTAPQGEIYYTINGGDPRSAGGGVAPEALLVGVTDGETLVGPGASVRLFVPQNDAIGFDWVDPDFEDNNWVSGTTGVGYEVHSGYESLITTDVRDLMYEKRASIYLRIQFTVDDPTELTFLTLRMKYDDGFVAYVNGERVAAVNDPDPLNGDSEASGGHFDSLAVEYENFDITSDIEFLQPGTNVLAIHGLNFGEGSSDFLMLPELVGSMSNGAGISLEEPLTTVRARTLSGNTWSALDEATFVRPSQFDLRVTEIMYHPADPPPGSPFVDEDFEFVEIKNIGDETIDLRPVRVTGGIRFDFSSGEVDALEPGAYVVITENLEAFATRYDVSDMSIAGQYDGRLSNNIGSFGLVGALDTPILELGYVDAWYPQTDGFGASLLLASEDIEVDLLDQRESWTGGSVVHGTPGRGESNGGSGGWQIPGDTNQDGDLDIADVHALLLLTFIGPSAIALPCEGATVADGGNLGLSDIDGSGGIDITDAVALLSYLFIGGAAPPVLGIECVRMEDCPDVCVP